MAELHELGLYNATVVDALLCESTKTDKDTGMGVAYQYLNVKVELTSHQAKTGETTELEARPVVEVRKYLTGKSLEDKAGEITIKQLRSVGGELLDSLGMDAFIAPHNAKLVGREIQVLCSINKNNDKYRNWEIYSPGVAAPKVPATKQATSALNAKLGFKPVVKKAPVQQQTTVSDTPAESFV